MAKKYIGKVHSSKFRRKNRNTIKKGRKGRKGRKSRKSRKSRKGRKTMKKRRMQIGGGLNLSPTTHVHFTTARPILGSLKQNPSEPQIEEIRKLLANMPVDDTYLKRGMLDM